MFKGAKKEDLKRIASELELCMSDKLTAMDLMDLIKNCERFKNDPDSVHELANLIIDERKMEESQQLELEKIREKAKMLPKKASFVLCFSQNPGTETARERVIQPSSVGVQKHSEREGEFLNGQLTVPECG
ncbi:hypothetical protein TNCT_295451 [Trichonephila clavata]|uniref:Uncharacterized protein n=1 Tax=Trichonephila clavata TaxID=2740835 RepID=A0A8X6LV01_TRICU|nr:hypothetical protein TNCT_295451 [Trichonephila clavata]